MRRILQWNALAALLLLAVISIVQARPLQQANRFEQDLLDLRNELEL